MTIRLLLCDDQEWIRVGLRAVFAAADGIEVIGEAADGSRGVTAARALRADVVLMDVRMPGMDGIEATRRLLAPGGGPAPKVVMLTVVDREQDALAALQAGASGYVVKDASPDELVGAVRGAARGGTVLAPVVARYVLDNLPLPQGRRGLPDLSDSDRDLLRLVAEGRSNAAIARALFLSEGTVRTYVSRLLKRLGVRDRTGAAVLAYDAGLVRPGGTARMPARGRPAGGPRRTPGPAASGG